MLEVWNDLDSMPMPLTLVNFQSKALPTQIHPPTSRLNSHMLNHAISLLPH